MVGPLSQTVDFISNIKWNKSNTERIKGNKKKPLIKEKLHFLSDISHKINQNLITAFVTGLDVTLFTPFLKVTFCKNTLKTFDKKSY